MVKEDGGDCKRSSCGARIHTVIIDDSSSSPRNREEVSSLQQVSSKSNDMKNEDRRVLISPPVNSLEH